MKRSLLILICLVFAGVYAMQAQTNVTLHINHMLGNQSFEMDMPAKNNMDNDFKYTRVQYYISEIMLVHDGGTRTPIDESWVLVDADNDTEIALGDLNITQLEKVTFHIGVDSDHNHLDPASWPSGHPLAPVFPSMHWGWSAGYRFIALEGNGGPSYNRNFQLHGLGDRNYFQTEVSVDLTAENGAMDIYLDADYTRALENIGVNSGVIVHGETLEAAEAIENFRDYVFSQGQATSSVKSVTNDTQIEVYPNPANGMFTLNLTNQNAATVDISILNMAGVVIASASNQPANGQQVFNIETKGLYTIRVISDRGISTNKVIIQ
ncbi:MAG: T9SS type A sorting domain-containing protein [Saprospiraceae bacterium]|nr:T9SS type A sorting domain-containing protein [Saprospiraceae bacterium]